MSSHVVTPFRRMLNKISSELDADNVASMVLLAEVPAGERSGITKGLHLFHYLIQRGHINERDNDVKYLRELLHTMKPRRPDLVEVVEDYIKRTHNVEASELYGELIVSIEKEGRCGKHNDGSDERCEFQLKLSCPECSMCYVLVLVVVPAVVFLSVFWHVHNDETERKLKIFVLVILCLILIAALGHYCWTKNRAGRVEYVTFENSSIQEKSTKSVPTSPVPSTPLVDAATSMDGRAVSETKVFKYTTSCDSFFTAESYKSGNFGSVSSADVV